MEQNNGHMQIMHKTQFCSSFNKGNSMTHFCVACAKPHLKRFTHA